MRTPSLLVSVVTAAALAGCGGGTGAAGAVLSTSTTTSSPRPSPRAVACALTTLGALRTIAQRVYAEDASSTNERLDLGLVRRSSALQAAAAAGDPAAARAAARALITSGHVARIRLTVGGRVLTDIGDPAAIAPVSATLTDASGAPIGTVLVAVQSGSGYLSTVDGLTDDGASVRSGGRVLAGVSPTGRAALPANGLVTVKGTAYAVASFPVRAFSAGTVRVTLVHPVASTAADCGSTPQSTVANAVGHAVAQIYDIESHGASLNKQARRVQTDPGLLAAVSARDPAAIRAAIVALLTQHIVRVRVVAPGLAPVDVGGPFVLGPLTVPLRRHGRTIGSAEISIQDDLGLVLLARRLVGVQVVVRLPPGTTVTPTEAQLVASSSVRVGGYLVRVRGGTHPTMSTLANPPATIPSHGTVTSGGRTYSVASFTATAFPAGPLPVSLLVPVPYR